MFANYVINASQNTTMRQLFRTLRAYLVLLLVRAINIPHNPWDQPDNF